MSGIRYSLRAQQEEIELLERVENEFGQRSALALYQHIRRILTLIQRMPDMYPASKKFPELHKCIFSKQTSLYYRYRDGNVEVICFRDNRKNPSDFKVEEL